MFIGKRHSSAMHKGRKPVDPRRSRNRHIRLACTALAPLLASVAPAANDTRSAVLPVFYGVNLASAEFAPEKLPGVANRDYIYPSAQTAAPFLAMGMNTVRLPFLWERLQPVPLGPLDKAELARLDKSIADLGGFKLVILDLHNYARYRGEPLDKGQRSAAMLADVWTKLAQRYSNQPKIAFGLMNEPFDIDGAVWRPVVDETVRAIRRTGARNLLLVPGVRWTGGHSWFAGGASSNATTLSGFKDPANNFLFEIHQYLDEDSSGTKHACSGQMAGRERLRAVTRWLREQRAGAVLAEFGSGQDPKCLAALDDFMEFLGTHGDVWRGWTYWAGGDWWGDYHLGIQPTGGRAKPQAVVLQRHLRRYAQSRQD